LIIQQKSPGSLIANYSVVLLTVVDGQPYIVNNKRIPVYNVNTTLAFIAQSNIWPLTRSDNIWIPIVATLLPLLFCCLLAILLIAILLIRKRKHHEIEPEKDIEYELEMPVAQKKPLIIKEEPEPIVNNRKSQIRPDQLKGKNWDEVEDKIYQLDPTLMIALPDGPPPPPQRRDPCVPTAQSVQQEGSKLPVYSVAASTVPALDTAIAAFIQSRKDEGKSIPIIEKGGEKRYNFNGQSVTLKLVNDRLMVKIEQGWITAQKYADLIS